MIGLHSQSKTKGPGWGHLPMLATVQMPRVFRASFAQPKTSASILSKVGATQGGSFWEPEFKASQAAKAWLWFRIHPYNKHGPMQRH